MSAEIQPGIYPHMANEFYHSVAGLSSTGLRLIDDCPKRYEHRYLSGNHQEGTQAMLIGEALHCMTLEPDSFNDRFAISEKFNGRTNEGKAAKAAFAQANAGKTIITVDDFALVSDIAKAVRNHPAADFLLSMGGKFEESFFWEEQVGEGSVLCKCRPDWRIPREKTLVDLKKTAKGVSSSAFSRTIHNFGYHFQAALYLRGVSIVTGEDYEDFIFIAVEEEPPHLVAVYQLDPAVISRAWDRIEQLLAIYTRCRENQYWPGYSDEISPIALPGWAR